MRFKFVEDLTSDVMFVGYGKGLKEVFRNSALAMFSVICQIKKVKKNKIKIVKVKADNLEELMFKWLQELIALVDTDNMFFSKFEIIEVDEKHLKARCYGEKIRPELSGTLVKGVTNYKYKFWKSQGKYKVRVVLDI